MTDEDKVQVWLPPANPALKVSARGGSGEGVHYPSFNPSDAGPHSGGGRQEVGILLQGIFPTQGSNPALMHFGQVLSHLSHQGSSLCSVCFSSLLLSETPFGAAGNNPSQLCSVFSWGPRHEMDQSPFLVNVHSRLVLRNDPAAQGWCFFRSE